MQKLNFTFEEALDLVSLQDDAFSDWRVAEMCAWVVFAACCSSSVSGEGRIGTLVRDAAQKAGMRRSSTFTIRQFCLAFLAREPALVESMAAANELNDALRIARKHFEELRLDTMGKIKSYYGVKNVSGTSSPKTGNEGDPESNNRDPLQYIDSVIAAQTLGRNEALLLARYLESYALHGSAEAAKFRNRYRDAFQVDST